MTPAHSLLFILVGAGVLAVVFVLGVVTNEIYASRRHPKPIKHVDLVGARALTTLAGREEWEGGFDEAPLVSHEGETVWIPAVPLPLFGLCSDRCACGKRFRGVDRHVKYEAHWRTEHSPPAMQGGGAFVQVTVEEARRAYESARAHA